MSFQTLGFALLGTLALAAAIVAAVPAVTTEDVASACTTSYDTRADETGAMVSVQTLTCPRPQMTRLAGFTHLFHS
jgi:hypothetical protein